MARNVPKPTELPEIYRQFKSSSNIVGVAYGAKITGGKACPDTPSIAFFVRHKIERLKTSSQWNGVKALPPELRLEAGTVVTDVVDITAETPEPTGTRTNKPVAVPGEEITYDGRSGTMACLVRDRTTGQTFALTNNHVAPDVNQQVKFRRNGAGFLAMPVAKTVLHLSDDRFMPFVDDPTDQLRVDASLIGLRDDKLDQFTNVAPHFGAVGAAFSADYDSIEQYRASLDQLPVYAYSFNTKRRFGRITHVYGVLDDPIGGTFAKACVLIMGNNGIAPSAKKDSGKLWMSKVAGINRPVGLHFGSQELEGTKLAAASDFGAICKFWNLTVV
jgi:hypothetical protein